MLFQVRQTNVKPSKHIKNAHLFYDSKLYDLIELNLVFSLIYNIISKSTDF